MDTKLLKSLLLGLAFFSIWGSVDALRSNNESDSSKNKVTHFSWGKIVVSSEGKDYTFKDCKLSPQGPQEWDWNEFGTRHNPGIQIQDLQSIINDSDIIILSRGVDLVLQTKPETIEYLKKLNKKFFILQSAEAVKCYNGLVAKGKKVGMLLHSTC